MSKDDLVIKENSRVQIKEILKQEKKNHIVLLLGTSGSARYTTLKLLSKITNITLKKESEVEAERISDMIHDGIVRSARAARFAARKVDDHAIMDLVKEEDNHHFSQAELLDLVFENARDNQRQAFLIRFLPDYANSEWIIRLLKKYYSDESKPLCPIFFSLSEEMDFVPVFKKKLEMVPSEANVKFKLEVVSCTSNETNIVKALERIIKASNNLNDLSSSAFKDKKEFLKNIARDTQNNIHLAMSTLQMLASKYRKNKTTRTDQSSLNQLKSEFGENIFHKIGKVLYNKRKVLLELIPPEEHAAIAKGKKFNYRYRGEAFDATKSQFYSTPQGIVDSLQSGRALFKFRVGIQSNYVAYCGDMRECAAIASGISRIEDLLLKIRKNNHNFEDDELCLTRQYCYNFMNRCREPAAERGRHTFTTITLKSCYTKPVKLSPRELDQELMSPELKEWLRQKNTPNEVPLVIEDDISDDSGSDNNDFFLNKTKNNPGYQPAYLKLSPVKSERKGFGFYSQIGNFSQSKLSQTQNTQFFAMKEFSNRSILDEIGDIISLSESSQGKIDSQELDELESQFCSMTRMTTTNTAGSIKTRLSVEAQELDKLYTDLNQLVPSTKNCG